MQGDAWDTDVVLETCSAERNAGSPPGREPSGDGVLVVVVDGTTVQGARESRVQGAGGQGTRRTQQGRHARCGAPTPFGASCEHVADAADPWRISLDNGTTRISSSTPTAVGTAMTGRCPRASPPQPSLRGPWRRSTGSSPPCGTSALAGHPSGGHCSRRTQARDARSGSLPGPIKCSKTFYAPCWRRMTHRRAVRTPMGAVLGTAVTRR
jgi:hypothetical protein